MWGTSNPYSGKKGDRARSLQRANPSGSSLSVSQHSDQSPLELLQIQGMGPWTAPSASHPTPQRDRNGQTSCGSDKDWRFIVQLLSLYVCNENISIWTSYLNINGDKEALLGDESSIHGDLYLEIEVLCLKEGSISTPWLRRGSLWIGQTLRSII